ncbi:MAG: VOC family protein [Chloroflexota bacterium]|nr:VOC family protein [Chloroflexota bacterium]
MSETRATLHITSIRTVGIPVADQEQALAFYTGTLGFEKRLDVPMGPGERWVEVAPEGAAATLALVRKPDANLTGIDTGIRLTSENVQADHAGLQASGVDVDAEVIPIPVPMFAFRDPDGNRLVIVGE